jgi:hypothetical protein
MGLKHNRELSTNKGNGSELQLITALIVIVWVILTHTI